MLNFVKVGVLPEQLSKSQGMAFFFKIGLQLEGPRGYFWDQISGLIFFVSEKIKGKIEGESIVGENGGKSNWREFLLKTGLSFI